MSKTGQQLAIGAGQMSRVDSARIAAWKGQEAAKEAGEREALTRGSVVASDAFFPICRWITSSSKCGGYGGDSTRRFHA